MRRGWMHRAILAVFLAAVLASGPGERAVRAQGPDGTADYVLNMRTGPGADQAVIAVLQPGAGLVLEARNADTSWVLGHTEDGALRGWVAALYLSYRDGFSPARLPESGETVAALVADAGAAAGSVPVSAPASVEAGVPVSLAQAPVIPVIDPRTAEIFARGQALGNNAHLFVVVGECNSLSQAFMVPFGAGTYDLGPYASLQATIDFYQQAPTGTYSVFWYKGMTLDRGLTSMAVIDPTLSNPAMCGVGVTLLECEYAQARPAVALIMLGLYDVYWLTPAQYEAAMRQIIEISIADGVIPVLITFPTHPGDTANWPNDAVTRTANRAAFNEALVRLGGEYGVPVINLWRAAEALYWHGLKEGDHQHLLEPPMSGGYYRAWFNGDEGQYGFTLYNLVALQTLDVLRTQVLGG